MCENKGRKIIIRHVIDALCDAHDAALPLWRRDDVSIKERLDFNDVITCHVMQATGDRGHCRTSDQLIKSFRGWKIKKLRKGGGCTFFPSKTFRIDTSWVGLSFYSCIYDVNYSKIKQSHRVFATNIFKKYNKCQLFHILIIKSHFIIHCLKLIINLF